MIKGKILLISAIVLLIFYIIFQDIILLLITSIIAIILLYSLFILLWNVKELKKINIKPNNIELKILAGTSKSIEAKIESSKSIKVFLEHPLGFCKINPQYYKLNEKMILEFSPILAGIYESEWIEMEVNSPFEIYSIRIKIPFKMKIIVLPRFTPILTRALELITGIGAIAYEVPIQILGKGTEYAETREYMLGDDLRHIDWKATARTQKLMIKQFYQDSGGSMNIIYDMKSNGPITKDKAITEFLNLATILTLQSIPYNIITIDENNNLKIMKFKDVKLALKKAIKIALEAIITDYGFLYEFIEPYSMRKILKIINEEIEEENQLIIENTDTIVITCLIGDLTWLMDIYEMLKLSNKKLIVYVPLGAWLDSKTLEQAYIDYEKQMKLINNLRKIGIEIRHSEVLKL
ncbi:MAG: DUF58 domain-containing protein [Candidatus Methanomethylicia archaeon]|nr:DUF58 domain-containing protein [Candidatus Methanomethylicia archaeon]